MTQEPDRQEVTQLLLDWRNGNKEALDRLLPLVYDQLHKLAVNRLRQERPGHTLQPTALIHEAYLRLIKSDLPDWKSRTHFFGVSAHIMRQILVDNARKHHAGKRGGGNKKVTLDEAVICSQERAPDLIALDGALQSLEKLSARKCQVIELRYFAGLSIEETAEALNISVATVGRDLRMAEAWLKREMAR
jgi:RNA polymerase sigma factor (TIGR02999 family)